MILTEKEYVDLSVRKLINKGVIIKRYDVPKSHTEYSVGRFDVYKTFVRYNSIVGGTSSIKGDFIELYEHIEKLWKQQ